MHPDIETLLRHIDGELDDAECRALEKHLDICSECRVEVRRLRAAVLPPTDGAAPPACVLTEIREWSEENAEERDQGVRDRMACAIGPYLGNSGSAAVLAAVSPERERLLPAVEQVLSAFLGRRAVGPLVDRIVEHAIMRS
jgi:anti-sigma factor RsiW